MQPSSRLGATQAVTVSGTSAQTASTLGDQTQQIRVVSTTACHIAIGDDSVAATTSDAYLPAGHVEYLNVTPGQTVAFIQSASGGTAYVTEID